MRVPGEPQEQALQVDPAYLAMAGAAVAAERERLALMAKPVEGVTPETESRGLGGGGFGGSTVNPRTAPQMNVKPRLAMADDPMNKGKPLFEVGGGRGGGASKGGLVPVRQYEPEIIPPSKAVAPNPTNVDWAGVLERNGFHPVQLKAMSEHEIQETGLKVLTGRLGSMLKPLIELGYTPNQVSKMSPADAYRAIKGKIISAPVTESKALKLFGRGSND